MSSETPGYFQFYFHHTEISFGEIVGKGYRKIIHESKYLIDLVFQTIEQIFPGRLRCFSPLPRSPFFRGRLCGKPLPDYKLIPFSEPLQRPHRKDLFFLPDMRHQQFLLFQEEVFSFSTPMAP